ncbi:MAG: hypothetical protein AAGG38_00940 [Planctomycetota bacterium]
MSVFIDHTDERESPGPAERPGIEEPAGQIGRDGGWDRERSDVRAAAVAPRPSRAWIVLQCVLVVLMAAAGRYAYEVPGVHFDEPYHLLPARNWVDHGTLELTPGGDPYTRARAFTYLVGVSYMLLGDSLASAQWVSLISGVGLVLLGFGWVRGAVRREDELRHVAADRSGESGPAATPGAATLQGSRAGVLPGAGVGAGLIAAGLMAFSLDLIHFSYMVRFYMLQVLVIWAVLMLVWGMLYGRGGRWARAACGGGAAAALLLAVHLQLTSVIAVAGMGLWAAGAWAVRAVRVPGKRGKWNAAGVVVLLGLAVAVGVLAVKTGRLDGLWSKYRGADLWVGADADDVWYYAKYYAQRFGWMWVGFPVAAALGFWRAPRATGFLLLTWAGGFVGQSFGGFKADRYVLYTLPMFMAIWGIGAAAGCGLLVAGARAAAGGLVGRRPALVQAAGVLAALLFLGVGAVGMKQVWSMQTTLRVALGQTRGPHVKPDWAAAETWLRAQAAAADAVVTSSSPLALYFIGRHDVAINASQLDDDPEFARDWRVDAPVISSAESLAKVIAEQPSGLIVVERDLWRQPAGVPVATADFIEARTQRLAVERDWRLEVFRWPGTPGTPGIPGTSGTAGLPGTPVSPD